MVSDWATVRFSHREVLQQLERGLLDPSNMRELEAHREISLRRASRAPVSTTSSPKKPRQVYNAAPGKPSFDQNKNKNVRSCRHWNDGICNQSADHQTGSVLWLHCCSFCLLTIGRRFSHKVSDCRKKAAKDASNNQGTGGNPPLNGGGGPVAPRT